MPSSGGHSSGSFGGGSHSSGHIGSTGSFNSTNHINTAHTNSNIAQGAFYANSLHNRSGNRSSKNGISGVIFSLIFMGFVTLFVLFSFLVNIKSPYPNNAVLSAVTEFPYEDEDFFSYTDDGITPLPSGFCEFKGVYYEEPENSVYIVFPEDFNSIMEKFREVTGVEPYVVITDSFNYDDIEQAAYDKYLDLFDDEGHFLLYFVTDGNDYEYELMVGDDARSYVFSESVLSVFSTSLDNRLDYSSPEEIQYALCDAFTEMLDFVNSCFSAYGESSPVRHPDVDLKNSYPFEDNEEYPFETEIIENDDVNECYAVIDDELIWYGRMNLLGKDDVHDSMIRFVDKEIASELMVTNRNNGEI